MNLQVSSAANDEHSMSRAALWLGIASLACGRILAQDQQKEGSSADNAEPATQNYGAMSLEQLLQVKVEGAAMHAQTLQDAPASVTIITAEDIRRYGYRTLGEALASVRGFYLNNDYTYENIGVRGFGSPSDYASDILFLVNGHSMTDNIFGFMLFLGNDFPIDMNLIRQIEIIRGPSSALYGTNGMFATINIVTKTPDEIGPATLTTTFDSFGEKKGELTAAAPLGQNAQVLFSGSVFNNSGESPIFVPQFNSPQTNDGEAIDMNTERGYHLFLNLTWRNWTIMAAFSGDNKIQPVSWGYTVFNDRGTENADTRNFVDATYARQFLRGTLTWRTFYDEQNYLGRFAYPLDPIGSPSAGLSDGIEDNRMSLDGKWIGSELRYRIDLGVLGTVTAGLTAKFDIRARQWDYDVSPAFYTRLDIDTPDRDYGMFLQDERKLSSQWTLDLGARIDKSNLLADFFSPRAALIYRPRSAWTFKFLYGRSFRDPSLYELYYGDGLSSVADPALRPEAANTVEIDAERKLGKTWNLLTAVYGYRLSNFIEGVPVSSGLIEYENQNSVEAGGVEVEIGGKVAAWLETTASYAVQRAENLGGGGVLANSPENLAKLRFAVPLGRKFQLSSGMQYTGMRVSLAQQAVPAYCLADFTLTSRNWLRNFDFTLGVRNAFNSSYQNPVALIVDTMPQPGRSLFVELVPHRAR